MDTSRRATVGALLAFLALSAGCLGFVTGDEPLEFEASEASVSASAAANAGYDLQNSSAVELQREIEFQGQTREIRITNHVAIYTKAVASNLPGAGADSGPPLAVFAVVSTPQASVAGQALNPLGRIPERQVVEQVLSRMQGMEDLREADSRTMQVLGTETEVVRFLGETTRSGRTVELYIEVTRVKHGGDFVIAIGAYPRALETEQEAVTTMMNGIQHAS